MKVSLSWLKDYVPIEIDPSDLAEALTMVGLEIESVSDRYGYLDTVYVGLIEEIAPHPNARSMCALLRGRSRRSRAFARTLGNCDRQILARLFPLEFLFAPTRSNKFFQGPVIRHQDRPF